MTSSTRLQTRCPWPVAAVLYVYYALTLGAADHFTYRKFRFSLHFLLNSSFCFNTLLPKFAACFAARIFATL